MTDTMADAIAAAKVFFQARARPDNRREWLLAEGPASYGDECNRVDVYTLEGSPVVGMIVANYGRKEVWAYSAAGTRIGKINARRF